jgi:hypothetical protein
MSLGSYSGVEVSYLVSSRDETSWRLSVAWDDFGPEFWVHTRTSPRATQYELKQICRTNNFYPLSVSPSVRLAFLQCFRAKRSSVIPSVFSSRQCVFRRSTCPRAVAEWLLRGCDSDSHDCVLVVICGPWAGWVETVNACECPIRKVTVNHTLRGHQDVKAMKIHNLGLKPHHFDPRAGACSP